MTLRNPSWGLHRQVTVNCCGHRWADPDDVDHAGSCPTNGQGRVEWWCAEHGYGCEPSTCPCGHTINCDCWSIANDH